MRRGLAFALAFAAAACGRRGFQRVTDAGDDSAHDAGDAGADAVDAAVARIAWVKPFLQTFNAAAGLTLAATAVASNAGDAILIHVYCQSTTAPTNVMLSAPGWALTMLSPLTGSTGTTYWGA